MAGLIAVEEARRRVIASVSPLGAEDVPLADALGRVLAVDFVSAVASPPFDTSAMDGFAVVAGPGGEREEADESRAGKPATATVEPTTAIRISTGARLPEGATAVIPLERVDASAHGLQVPGSEPGENIRRAGEDVRPGDVVLRRGTELGPSEVAVLASLGNPAPRCARRPRVAVLVTGDELVAPGTPLEPGMLWSSNGFALGALVERAGGTPLPVQHVPDSLEATPRIGRALEQADAVCVSGGVSVGPHDHVKPALAQLGVEERFWGVALKPGKPTWFGMKGSVPVFGLPGNPVSAMVTFHLFARPALRALQAADPRPLLGSAELEQPVALNSRRAQALRCRLRSQNGGRRATLTGEQGSHQLTSMVGADALVMVPQGDGDLPAGAQVTVELL